MLTDPLLYVWLGVTLIACRLVHEITKEKERKIYSALENLQLQKLRNTEEDLRAERCKVLALKREAIALQSELDNYLDLDLGELDA